MSTATNQKNWTDKYIGIPYNSQEMQCASFCVEVAREKFGIKLPKCPIIKDKKTDGVALLQTEWQKYTYKIENKEKREGDILLMKHGDIFHIGILVYQTQWLVLHMLKKSNSVLTPIERLQFFGFSKLGVYRWRN